MWGAAQQAGSRLVGIGEKSKRLRRGEISLAKSTLFPCLHCPSLSACVSQSTMLTYFLCFTSSGVEFSILSCLVSFLESSYSLGSRCSCRKYPLEKITHRRRCWTHLAGARVLRSGHADADLAM
jgi:hypothetical protein